MPPSLRLNRGAVAAVTGLVASACSSHPALVEAPVIVVVPPAAPAPSGPRRTAPLAPQEAHGDATFVAQQVWYGTYVCAQGTTRLKLIVASVESTHVNAVFDFVHEPSGARGKFSMRGTYDPQHRRVLLEANEDDWIVQPSGYVTVGLQGDVSPDGERIAGAVLGPGCERFTLHRGASKRGTDP
jgi:hypothetical protein